MEWVYRYEMGNEYLVEQNIVKNILNSTTISGKKVSDVAFLNHETAKIKLADGHVLCAAYDNRVYISFELNNEFAHLPGEYLGKLNDPKMFSEPSYCSIM